MIELPHRSVTRFFIPLIDVLTLLFCIFLLMPLIKAGNDPAVETRTEMTEELAASTPESLTHSALEFAREERARLRREREELEQMKRDKREVIQQKLFLRVLEIDADTGKLYYQEGETRREIQNQADALRLIREHRDAAEQRELYYLLMYPRRLTGYPLQSQVQRYEAWFKDVAHGIDNPHQGR